MNIIPAFNKRQNRRIKPLPLQSGAMVLLLMGLLVGCLSPNSPPGDAPEITLEAEITAPPPSTPTAALSGRAPAPPVPNPRPTTSPTPTATAFAYAFGPRHFPVDINPLTGLPPQSAALLERRPIAIKVTNFPREVRPQWGLSLADHVYEYYIGDGMSRFLGIFYGNDAERVGPIRSARLFDAHLMRMYRAIFVFGWADDAVLRFLYAPDLRPHLIVERPANCPPLCRLAPRNAYNNLFVDTTQIAAYLQQRRTNNARQDLSGLRFEAAIPPSGNPGEALAVRYSNVSYHRWEYDAGLGRYLRYQEARTADQANREYAPLMDILTQVQLSASNVVVLLVPHQFYLKSSSTEIIDQRLFGQGRGYAFRDGQIFPILWAHPQADALLSLSLPNQQPYPLKPGNTWFEVIGESSSFLEDEDGTWSFDFKMP